MLQSLRETTSLARDMRVGKAAAYSQGDGRLEGLACGTVAGLVAPVHAFFLSFLSSFCSSSSAAWPPHTPAYTPAIALFIAPRDPRRVSLHRTLTETRSRNAYTHRDCDTPRTARSSCPGSPLRHAAACLVLITPSNLATIAFCCLLLMRPIILAASPEPL